MKLSRGPRKRAHARRDIIAERISARLFSYTYVRTYVRRKLVTLSNVNVNVNGNQKEV